MANTARPGLSGNARLLLVPCCTHLQPCQLPNDVSSLLSRAKRHVTAQNTGERRDVTVWLRLSLRIPACHASSTCRAWPSVQL